MNASTAGPLFIRNMLCVDSPLWETAAVHALNDRYADSGGRCEFVVTNDAEERVLSSGVFGQPPDQYQLARFFLMQQVVHMFYAMAFVLFGSSGKPVNLSEKVPEFKDFHRRIWAGEVSLADNDMKIVCGRVHWEQLLQNMQQARFDEALRIVSDRHSWP